MAIFDKKNNYDRFLSSCQALNERVGFVSIENIGLPLEFIVWAYRLFLDREPENQEVVVEFSKTILNSRQLRQVFMTSNEYFAKNKIVDVEPPKNKRYVPLDIERIEQRNDLLSFFDHIKKTWTQLGDTEPHWSVLSLDAFKHERLASNIEAFYESGKPEVDALCDMLNARSISINYDGVCLEYGGGLGRVTKWFAQKFSEVVSCDISSSHIKLAKEYLLSQGIENVTLLQMSSIEDIENLPPADFIYSVIVLQHNPPPIIELILNNLLKSLKPGGCCLFQVPVYCANYTFSVDQYLNSVCNKSSTLNIEMHVLPREIVFEIIYAQKCMLVDVFEDDWAGQGYVSNTFIVRKPVS